MGLPWPTRSFSTRHQRRRRPTSPRLWISSRAEPRAARGGHPRGRAAARHRRRRLGQDPGAHPPHRPSHPQRGRIAVRDPGHHVHQQGRRRDEAARRPRSSARSRRRCGCRPSTRACVRILRRDGRQLGYPSSFTIYDQADAVRLAGLRDARPRPRPEEVPAAVGARHDQRGQERRHRRRGVRRAGAGRSSSARSPRCTAEYQARLATGRRDGLRRPAAASPSSCSASTPTCSSTTGSGSSTCSSTSTRTPTACRTSSCCCLAAEHRNVFVVGDSDQSIYSFRGADIRNILEFEEAFPDATVIVLEQNYRSTQTILDAANAVIANNFGRKPKELWTDNGARRADHPLPRRRRDATRRSGSPTRWRACTTAVSTAGATSRSSTAPTRRAVCSRSTSMRVGIPYKVIGGTRFYDRREVKDALAYLRAVGEPGRRGERQARPQRAQARRRRQHGRTSSTRWPTAHGCRLHRRAAAAATMRV